MERGDGVRRADLSRLTRLRWQHPEHAAWGRTPSRRSWQRPHLFARTVARIGSVASEQKSRGRPSELDASTSGRLAASLVAGSTLTAAASEIGVSRRTATGWMARAWSRYPRDAEAVRLVQMVVRGRIAAPEAGQPRPEPLALVPLDDVLRDLDDGWP